MENSKSVFLSFSSQDMSYVNELMAALKHQNVDVWDYSNEDESIRGGEKIDERLKKEIDSHDVFIPVISSNSMNLKYGEYTRLETRYALKEGKEIQAIKHPGAPDSKKWIEPYSAFKGNLFIDFDIWDDRSFIRALIKLCNKLGVDFQPLDKAHKRLPFWSDFRKEVANISKSNYNYSLMMEYLWAFNKYFFMEDYKQAELLIRIFAENCEYLLPDYKPFYPLIVWAVCLRHTGRLEEAEVCYLQAQDNRPGYDEQNIYAGLGGIALERTDYETSYAYYQQSLKANASEFNADEKYNYVVASLNAKKEIDTELGDFVLNMEEGYWGKKSVYLYQTKSLILSRRNAYEEANLMLNQGILAGHQDELSYLFMSRNLHSMDKREEAISLLEDTLLTIYPDSGILAREIMELTKMIPENERALHYFEQFIAAEENTREELIEYALLLSQTKKMAKMKEIALRVLEYSRLNFPASPLELYYDGFAHFLLDDQNRAACYYEKAGLKLPYYKALI